MGNTKKRTTSVSSRASKTKKKTTRLKSSRKSLSKKKQKSLIPSFNFRGMALASIILLALVGLAGFSFYISDNIDAVSGKPNILLIVTDDQEAETLSKADMPKTFEHLVNNGAKFNNAYAAEPVCCPSRASILTGQYSHNNGVLNNNFPTGGFKKFNDKSTLATWLNDGGYQTALMGKYLNEYHNTKYIPPGWDRWFGFQEENKANYNGRIGNLKKADQIKSLTRHSTSFIQKNKSRPWFLMLTPKAPHTPYLPSDKYAGSYKNKKMPQPAAFNEADVSDKPAYVQNLPRLSPKQIANTEKEWRVKMEYLRDVDDLVGSVLQKLRDTNQAKNTYVIFVSDNGWLGYKHRLKGKGAPYEESTKVPFAVKGPGVNTDDRQQIVSLVDLAQTIATWAGVDTPSTDGLPMNQLLKEPSTPWRQSLLVEKLGEDSEEGAYNKNWQMLVNANGERYIEYENGEKEYYDLSKDPQQMKNSITPNQISKFSPILAKLKLCSGDGCRVYAPEPKATSTKPSAASSKINQSESGAATAPATQEKTSSDTRSGKKTKSKKLKKQSNKN